MKLRAANPTAPALPRVLQIGTLLCCTVVCAIATAFPSSRVLAEAHGDSAAHHGPSLSLLLLNFGLYIAVMWVLLRKTVAGLWVSRSEGIRDSVERSQSLLREAQEAHAEAVQAEAALGGRIAELRADRITSANEEARDLIGAARERAKRLLEQAGQLAEAERSRRLDSIRRDFSADVIGRAEEVIRRRLSDDTDRRMREIALSNDRGLALLSD